MKRPTRRPDPDIASSRFGITITVLLLLFLTVSVLLEDDDDEIALPFVDEATTRAARLRNLVRWAHKAGAALPKTVKLAHDLENGWGFYANVSMNAHEKVCQLPNKLFVLPNDEGSHIFNLAFRVLRNPSSPYVLSLPWEDFARYKATAFDDDIKLALDAIDEKWDPQLFRAAVLIVLSRVHRVNNHPFALVPLCDMFNASPNGRFNVECEDADNTFLCSTTRTVRANEQLLVAYRTSEHLLVPRDTLKKQWLF